MVLLFALMSALRNLLKMQKKLHILFQLLLDQNPSRYASLGLIVFLSFSLPSLSLSLSFIKTTIADLSNRVVISENAASEAKQISSNYYEVSPVFDETKRIHFPFVLLGQEIQSRKKSSRFVCYFLFF